MKAGDKTFKTHLDGYNFMPFFKGEVDKGPRREIFYFDDNANLNALRYNDWKISFAWIEGNLFTGRRVTAERADRHQPAAGPVRALHDQAGGYEHWWADKLWTLVPARPSSRTF